MSNHTTFDEFTKLAKQGSFVPVSKEVTADLLTDYGVNNVFTAAVIGHTE